MFKNIQNYLLLRHPLLWNIKLVPMLAVTILFNIIFLIIGYLNGAINFTDPRESYYDDTPLVVIFFSVFIALLVFTVWLVFYFRNNAYKSFYPQSANVLYKEWCLITLICLLNCSYSASFLFAKDFRIRSYFTEAEFSRRVDILSMASIFIEAEYRDDGYDEAPNHLQRRNDAVIFDGKAYVLTSLLNKTIESYSYQGFVKDTVLEHRVKSWLTENRKDSVLWVMKEFDKIAKSHNLKSNISPEKWLSLVYDYPAFNSPIVIAGVEKVVYGNYNGQYTTTEVVADSNVNAKESDTLSYQLKIENDTKTLYSKYYVPFKALNRSYSTISQAWANPDFDKQVGIIYLYFGIMTSLAVFSYRVTSGRNWLIALVASGIIGIISTIAGIAASSYNFSLCLWLTIFIIVLVYYIYICNSKENKGYSDVILNNLLWMMPWFLPLLYAILLTMIDTRYTANNSDYDNSLEKLLRDNYGHLIYVNLLFIFIYMYFLTRSIKKWKGIAEG
ncbi:hypothetical protein [Flavobacterium subsaxonicum]|uniref:Uncharacterized protein n=1 Tax=Flavobacterium subsaxonicum WB 4.1-42 = DSM 21790 TaxID=1121898 RepID=A0A0A2MUH9_9FLAO|nr:hypothetical protein [Flavobacterium subsaxonicum]KGO91880.1 hypothetical protein Q766_15675 [Flavobacterium subsaxonicum WB 4.1-42 = DSM 21790]